MIRIVFHYFKEKGYIGTIGVKSNINIKSDELAHTSSEGKVYSIKSSISSEVFDNKYNIISTLEHEADPVFEPKSQLKLINSDEYKFLDHALVYLDQAISDTFKNTTVKFKIGVAYAFAVRLYNVCIRGIKILENH